MRVRARLSTRLNVRRPRRPMPPAVRVHGTGKDRRCRKSTRQLLEEALAEWGDDLR